MSNLITPENGNLYFEKGRALYIKKQYTAANDWFKKALFVFQKLRDQSNFVDTLRIMANALHNMGKSTESDNLSNIASRYAKMTRDVFEQECDSIVFTPYTERPTFFNTKQSQLLSHLLNDLKSLS